nr:50S ribosomal protein L20 isoform X1 [Nicotiana tomentosiformis]
MAILSNTLITYSELPTCPPWMSPWHTVASLNLECMASQVVNYGNFMHGLMKENVQLNRKVLSELSMLEPYSFNALVDISRSAFPGNKTAIVPPKKEGLAIVL